MHQKHFKTEKERIEAEEKEMSAAKKANLVDFESLLKNYPKKFDVSKCQSTERTFPSCTSPVKAPVEMMTHLELIKSQIIPAKRKEVMIRDLSDIGLFGNT